MMTMIRDGGGCMCVNDDAVITRQCGSQASQGS